MANGKNISKTVAITTLGCKINQFESAAMSETLDKDGFRIVSFDDPSDIYVINTCTVTAKTDAESRRLIRRASRQNPAARIVVTGCYAQRAPEELAQMAGVALVVGNSNKTELPDLIARPAADSSAAIGLPSGLRNSCPW